MSDLISHRAIDPESSDVHVGLDGGQGMLKIGLTITDRDKSGQPRRSKYSDVSILTLLTGYFLL